MTQEFFPMVNKRKKTEGYGGLKRNGKIVESALLFNYGANHVRVKGHLKVLCHLMFGVLVLTAKQIFNYFA